jgi:rod shape-determining protein MreD
VTSDGAWLRGGLVLVLVFVVHEAVLRGLRIDGVRPDLLLGLGIVAALVVGPEQGAVLAFAAGLLGDLFVNTPFGLSALVACVVAFLAGSVQAALGPHQKWSVPVLPALASVAGELLWAAVGTVLGLPGLLNPHLVAVALVVAAVNTAVSLPLAALIRWTFSGAPAAKASGFA